MSKKADEPNFLLDLGAVYVTVEIGDLHNGALGLTKYADRKIILDVAKIGGQNLTATLLHECLHHLDDLFLGGTLGGAEDSIEHKRLDTLANVIDMLISRNWLKFRELYDAKEFTKGKK